MSWLQRLLLRAPKPKPIVLDPSPRQDVSNAREIIDQLGEHAGLRIWYRDVSDVESVRDIAALSRASALCFKFWRNKGVYTTRVFCHLRHEPRTFRIDRIRQYLPLTKDECGKVAPTTRLSRWFSRKRSALVALWRA